MSMMIFGCGYSGQAIADACMKTFAPVAGTTRSPEKAAALKAAGIAPYIYKDGVIGPDLQAALKDVTHLVQSIAPGPSGDPLLGQGPEALRALMPKLQWIGYLSTVGVYGDHHGAWVDENAPLKPVSLRSTERVEAERGWQAMGVALGVPVAILRLSGIYGPGRNALANLENGTARRIVKKDQVFNRIRVEDIGAATLFLGTRRIGGVFNVTDSEPCPPQDVVAFAAGLMGIEPPPEVPFETADMTPMARSFYGENKRVSNAKIRDLGFSFAYPDYRSAFEALWKYGDWRAKR